MPFTKFVGLGSTWSEIPYAWYDYLMLPVRMFLFAVLYLLVMILTPTAMFLQWAVRHPQMQIQDRRESND